jgi:putative transposase
VLNLFTEQEAERLAWETGFYQREPREIRAFAFVLCCTLAAVIEHKRGFASVWRVLAAIAGIDVARSAVTQRFGAGSAALLEALFRRALERLPAAGDSELRKKLNQFHEVLAQDGTVLRLSPLLAKLFPATRTNVVDAAAKAHVTADLLGRHIVEVTITGERGSELDELVQQSFEKNTLYIHDLGYTSYDMFWLVEQADAFLLMRLKENANPKVVRVRQGVRRPRSSVGCKFQDLEFCRTQDRFDIDVEFEARSLGETVTMRVVGLWNPETGRYHCYVTNLPPEQFDIEELANLYRLRWTIELIMKLLKSHCHLDHLDTANPDALRTHLYASLLAAVVLQSMLVTAARSAGLSVEEISFLTVGISAPLLAVPLLLLWLERELSYDEMAALIFRTIVHGCRDQNPKRTRENAAAPN